MTSRLARRRPSVGREAGATSPRAGCWRAPTSRRSSRRWHQPIRRHAAGAGARSFLLGLLTLPVWIALFNVYGLYDRDSKRISYSTVDDFPRLFHSLVIGSAGALGLLQAGVSTQTGVDPGGVVLRSLAVWDPRRAGGRSGAAGLSDPPRAGAPGRRWCDCGGDRAQDRMPSGVRARPDRSAWPSAKDSGSDRPGIRPRGHRLGARFSVGARGHRPGGGGHRRHGRRVSARAAAT